ncbi:imidazole glycerol phosphate synthase HisHF [Desulfotalea psychrophila]|uniref:Imidazole glycerol phosphate synthase subunit HisH n=1 Tax=Desulfotalea psychrophila (strain LSv54 / DSM 12343) TaxID=177439 RepID=Q6AL79_DESPS|nr:imidazole glycerol phosphate synthase HisHF [Desulfotalea psychrophila]CAG36896.1 related to bifunctional histidine biosynthesis protein (HisHF) [Desulfotalea psychrophila LSv54]
MKVTLLDYGAGNVRSIRNAIRALGCEIVEVQHPEDILTADKLIFPGVGSFGSVMHTLRDRGYIEPLKRRIEEDKPFLGICVALQALFEGSEETPGVAGLGILPGQIKKFVRSALSVPQIGWNGIHLLKESPSFAGYEEEKLYFVHSYHAPLDTVPEDWALTATDYGTRFISAVEKGNVTAFQFHPEKSGQAGLNLLQNFLSSQKRPSQTPIVPIEIEKKTEHAKRVIACLDVRSNDNGDLVVTKGDQYDVRQEGEVRNLGKPVDLARRYYQEGADEVTFLNITGFRDFPMEDQPMIEVLQKASENVFVPLTIGGGIRDFTDSNGKYYSALDVAAQYFRSGADKISIGSDAVAIVEEYLATGKKSGKSSIEQISAVYGVQAVVISVDPRRVYVQSPDETTHTCVKTGSLGPNGEEYCWYQCTIKGGREGSKLDAVQLVQGCEALGAGEILLNCIDKDGTNDGFELELISLVKKAVSIPVIASSGAGSARDFVEVFRETDADAALAAGIFHREEVPISEVKTTLMQAGISCR